MKKSISLKMIGVSENTLARFNAVKKKFSCSSADELIQMFLSDHENSNARSLEQKKPTPEVSQKRKTTNSSNRFSYIFIITNPSSCKYLTGIDVEGLKWIHKLLVEKVFFFFFCLKSFSFLPPL